MLLDVFLEGVPPRRRSAELFDQLRSAILGGRLAPGDRLPASRDLAAELGVARSTVTTVYARLVGEGYAEGRVGDGTFVADHHSPANRRPRTAVVPSAVRIPRPAPSAEPSLVAPEGGWRADLRTGRPDPALFPTTEWRRCATSTLDRPPPGYGDYAGLPELRQAIAAWVARSRGVRAAAEDVLVTAGAQGAFDLCARTLLRRGDVVAVEEPGYEPARRVLAHHGVQLVGVPVDEDGIQVDRIPSSARAVVVTPSHQMPTGAVLSAARRRQLLDLADTSGAVVIEDDYDTELRYVDRPLEPVHLLDRHGRVVYVGSFSKVLSPSLRLGFLVAPPDVIEQLTSTRRLVDTQPPHLTQATLAAYLATGGFERHLRRCHRTYRPRRDHLLSLLDGLVGEASIATFDRCNAGLHTVVRLPPGTDVGKVAERLRRDGIAITTTAEHRLGGGPIDLLVGFGLADEHALDMAADALRRVVAGEVRQV